jgi:hypothetical protein
MTRPENVSVLQESAAQAGGYFDVAVLVENELTGTSARRMTELYQMKSTPLRYHLVRPVGKASARSADLRQEAERLMQKSVERLEALQVPVTGVVSDHEPIGALLDVVTATRSQEVVVVTGQHRLATLLHRDLASQVHSLVDLPVVHLVER